MNKLEIILKLAELMSEGSPDPGTAGVAERYIGKQVIIRSYSAGNHFGTLIAYDPAHGVAVLKDARRLWRWQTDRGVSLSEIANYGVVVKDSKICTVMAEQIVAEIDEILPCSQVAAVNIQSAPVYKP